jgi:hypothetical protein
VSQHVLDSFIVRYVLDASGYDEGERDIGEANKRLRENNKVAFGEMERRGKAAGEVIKGVRNEVVGLGLAFLGAQSITGLASSMMTGAASAERLGNTMGMATGKVWAWRQAMAGVGGQEGDADAALSSIQRDKMGYRLGQLEGSKLNIYGRLGITGNDLRDADPGAILQKLADAQGKMNPQKYSSFLQQVGMPQSMIYFLNQGKVQVDKQIAALEANSDGQEELAAKTEELQKSTALLKSAILEKLVPPLLDIVNLLTILTGGKWGNDKTGITLNGKNAYDYIGEAVGGKPGAWVKDTFGQDGTWTRKVRGDAPRGAAGGGGGALGAANRLLRGRGFQTEVGQTTVGGSGRPKGRLTRAERNNNPGNIEDGPFARRQAGYAGTDGRFAKFDTPEHGFAAMEALLGVYGRKGRRTISSIIAMWAPAHENDVKAYAGSVERQTGINRNQVLTQDQIRSVARAMAKHEGYRGGGSISIGHITVNTKATDANGIARDLNGSIRRHAVSQADRGIAP